MRLLFPILLLLFSSCLRSGEKKLKEVAIRDLQLGPVVQDSITGKQLREIKRIHRALEEVISLSLEETITNFKRDRNPDNEIAIWSHMADAYERFTLNKHFEEHDKKDEAFQILLLRSMMPEEEVLQKIDISYLTKAEVEELFSYYKDVPGTVTVNK